MNNRKWIKLVIFIILLLFISLCFASWDTVDTAAEFCMIGQNRLNYTKGEKMKTYKKTDLAYAAGLIDCDGCIYIDRFQSKKQGRSLTYVLRVKFAQTDKQAIEYLNQLFGGSWRTYDYKNEKRLGKKPLHIWQINNRNAAKFLQIIRPYLKIKIKQSDVAIEFAETLFEHGKGPRKDGRDYRCLPNEILESREKLAIKMRQLNQRRNIK